ncbi:MAG: hypothetical protein U5N55_00875 [Cypionkella sp.]|nr:hypothetical protein [Cypionkella sp.]
MAAAEEKAKADEKAAKEREKADRARLRECRRNNIDEALCPPLPDEDKPDEPEVVNGLTIGPPAISASAPAGGAGDAAGN